MMRINGTHIRHNIAVALFTTVICTSLLADPILVQWDTIYSYENKFGDEPDGEYVALAVSNFGEIGQAGAGGVNMDFTTVGTECGTRHADSVYLFSASPFLLEANYSATEVNLTCSYGQTDTSSSYSWIPVEWDPEQVLYELQCYIRNIAPCGKFVNRERTIAVEMFRVLPDHLSYIDPLSFLFLTRIYSIDGQSHERLSFGWVVDWNIPSDLLNHNVSAAGQYGERLYIQGTDTVGSDACQLGSRRFAWSVSDWGFTPPFDQVKLCGGNVWSWGTWYGPANLLDEVIDQPDALAWWNEIGLHSGKQIAEFDGNLAIWHTFAHDYDLAASDTVYSWISFDVLRDGDQDDPLELYNLGGSLYHDAVDCTLDCPWGMVGDANGLGGEEPSIGDVSVMIDAKFITGTCDGIIECMGEADINRSGGYSPDCDDITIGDISYLIDYLFIGGPSVVELPCCWF